MSLGKQKTAQMFGPLSLMWETWINLSAPGFSLPGVDYPGYLGDESADGRILSLSFIFCNLRFELQLFSICVAGAQTFGPSSTAFPLAGSWIKNEAVQDAVA